MLCWAAAPRCEAAACYPVLGLRSPLHARQAGSSCSTLYSTPPGAPCEIPAWRLP